jgi:TnsA endonuclease N terminal
MARSTAKGEFVPKNPNKYQGKLPIIYRSSWEFTAMQMFDLHPNVLAWQSESLQIPYYNPLAKRWSVYIPDFLVLYVDKGGKQYCELMEVKPLKEVTGYQQISERTGKAKKLSPRDQAAQAINAAKWTAALEFCAKRNWSFRVVTEDTLFSHKRKT